MKDIEKHKEEFERIVKKYKLFEEDKAQEIAKFLTKSQQSKIDALDFANLFAMSEEEAIVFLSFIEKGLEFKKKHLDKN